MRKTYLDTVRWATVLLVLVYHVCYIFNGVGVPGGIPGAESIPALDAAASMVYPWFMALLFVVAGISARYSLQKRTARQFLKERAVKLLVPSTLGLFAVHWVTGYLNIRMGGGLAYIPPALVYPISAISGIGPLWFIQTLFLFSCLLVPLRKLDKKDRLWTLCGRANLPVILLLFLPLWGGAQVLNMPLLTMYRFGNYFTAFLIGYFVLSHEGAQEKLEKARVPLLCLAVIGAVLFTAYYYGSDYTSPQCLQSLPTNVYAWVAILAVLGCARKYLNRETAFGRYMTKAGFGIYILHYPVLMCAGYFLHACLALPPLCNYLIALVAEFAGTFALFELVKRIPVARWLVLGMKKP